MKREGICPRIVAILRLLSDQVLDIFMGKLRKNALDIIKVPLKNEYSTIDYVRLLTIFQDFLRGVPPF